MLLGVRISAKNNLNRYVLSDIDRIISISNHCHTVINLSTIISMRILGLLIFLAFPSVKADTFHMICTAADVKSSIEITSTNDKMVFSYINNAGKKYFPLYSGVVTAQTLPYLKTAKYALSNLGPKIEFSWPLDQCTINEDQLYLVKCMKNAVVTFPKHTGLRANSFSTSLINEQTFSFSYEKLSVRFILMVDNKNYEIAIPFSKERCFVNYEK